MKNSILKKMTAVLSIAAITFSMTACGTEENGGNSKPGSQTSGNKTSSVVTEMDPNGNYFKAEYVDFKLQGMSPEFYNMKPAGNDTIVFTAYDEEYNKSVLCSYDLMNNSVKTITEAVYNYANPLEPSTNIEAYTADSEGGVYVYATGSQLDMTNVDPDKVDYSKYTKDDVISLFVSWGSTATQAEKEMEQGIKEGWYKQFIDENGEMDWGRYYVANTAYELPHTDYKKLQKYDKSGNLVYEISDFNILGDNSDDSGSYSYISSMLATDDGKLVFVVESYSMGMPMIDDMAVDSDVAYYEGSQEQRKFVVVSKEGVIEKEIPWEGDYINGVYTLNDGSIGVAYYNMELHDGRGGYTIAKLNIDKGTTEGNFEIPFDYFNSFIGLSGDEYLVGYNAKLYKVNIVTGEANEYINWLDCDMNGNNIQTVMPLSDGRIFVASSYYDYAAQKSGYESVYMTQIPFSEVPKKEYINLVCTYTDDMMLQYVINYNKTSDKYRIRVTPFEYDNNSEVDYFDQLKSFMTAVVSDDSIDILVSDSSDVYSTFANLSRKGLLVDISQYMTGSVKKDDFIPSALKAFSQGEKVFAVPVSVSPNTLIGRADVVGSKENWSLDEALEAVKKRESNVQILPYVQRSDMLNQMICLNYQSFIDENNKCHFDNGDMEKILEFCKEFPEEINYDDYRDEVELFQDKKLMLANTSLNDLSQVQLYEGITNVDFTYVGYPSSTGHGTMLYFGNMLGITKNCDVPEEAWKFMEQYFTSEAGAYNYYGGYPTVKKQFDSMIAKKLEEQERYGGSYSYGYNEYNVEIQPPTKAEYDFIKDMIYNSTGLSNAVSSDVLAIILEEAGAYFADQKSADDVVNIIQSRVSIKLSEQE